MEELTDLVGLVREAAAAFVRGDMRHYVALMQHTDDYTLMSPQGGDTTLGFDRSDENLAQMARFFRRGDAVVDVVDTYASGDLAVLVAVERQHGEVGDYPDQDWSLRVTLVFRREGSVWRLAHRHADPLVRAIAYDHLAALARGGSSAAAPPTARYRAAARPKAP
jgi:ketosteroid isomerase-like protein